MTTIFSPPSKIKIPEFDYRNMAKSRKAEKDYLKQLKEWCIERNPTKDIGEIISFPVADGHASYMIASLGKKSELIHIPLGDAWQFQYINRLTATDIKNELKKQKAMEKLFGKVEF